LAILFLIFFTSRKHFFVIFSPAIDTKSSQMMTSARPIFGTIFLAPKLGLEEDFDWEDSSSSALIGDHMGEGRDRELWRAAILEYDLKESKKVIFIICNVNVFLYVIEGLFA
jgi:hypothetical protein